MKIIIMVLLVFSLMGCSLEIRDPDGFLTWNFARISEESIYVQSRGGYVAHGLVFYEKEFLQEVLIQNPHDYNLQVRITDKTMGQRWIVLQPQESIKISNIR